MDRSDGRKPFLLRDGHGSRFGLNFLKYVIDPAHGWVVCIGVPYGTALWQVGDSSEQNGAYKIALAKCIELLLKKKQTKMMLPTIEGYEIIILINYVCAHSFPVQLQIRRQSLTVAGFLSTVTSS